MNDLVKRKLIAVKNYYNCYRTEPTNGAQVDLAIMTLVKIIEELDERITKLEEHIDELENKVAK